jgi:hypothetical protein
LLPALHAAAMAVTAKTFVAQGLTGEAIGAAMRDARLQALSMVRSQERRHS